MNPFPIRAGRWLALAPILLPAIADPAPRDGAMPPPLPAMASTAVAAGSVAAGAASVAAGSGRTVAGTGAWTCASVALLGRPCWGAAGGSPALSVGVGAVTSMPCAAVPVSAFRATKPSWKTGVMR